MTLPLVILSAGLALAAGRPAPAVVTLNVATIHAAALTTARDAADAADAPFVLASVLGPGRATGALRLPASAQFHIKADEAVGTQPLTTVTLAPGDSVRVLLTVLEGERTTAAQESAATASIAAVMRTHGARRSAALRRAMAPLERDGTHWIGSVAVLLTNEGGTTHWRAFECVASCTVLNAPPSAALAPSAAQAAVAEFTGAGGTYHMQVQGVRAP